VSWVIAAAGFGLLAIFRKRSPKILAKVMWIINGLLAFITGAALANTWLGQWVAQLFAGLFGWIGGWFGTSSGIVAGVLVLLIAAVVLLDLMDRVADQPAIAGLIILPLLFLITAGPIDAAGESLYAGAERIGQSSIGRLVGG
jgi:uncharacterized membrane protein